MSAPQAAAITACTACAAVGGAAAGGAFSSSETSLNTDVHEEHDHGTQTTEQVAPKAITYKFLADELSLDSTNYGTGTVADKYKNYLVGTFGGENNSNQEWWNDVYSKRYQEDLKVEEKKTKLSDELKDTAVQKAYVLRANKDAADQNKALNIGCHNLYKLQHKAKLIDDVTNKTKYINDLWRYCSELGATPKTIADANETDYDAAVTAGGEKVGKKQKAKLLSTKAEINNKLWDWKQKEFFARTDGNNLEHYFKAVHGQKETNKDKPGFFKSKCEEAYKMKAEDTDGEGKVKADTVVKYCSLDGETQT